MKADNDNQPRLLNRTQAAVYCGVKTTAFSDWVRRGTMPAALPGTKRWDRRAIDAKLDQISGLAFAAADEEDPYLVWKREDDARQHQGNRTR